MKPELKAYYLTQSAYWCQQLIVLLLRLEKPRKDYYELVAHHFVTLWLVGCACLLLPVHIGPPVHFQTGGATSSTSHSLAMLCTSAWTCRIRSSLYVLFFQLLSPSECSHRYPGAQVAQLPAVGQDQDGCVLRIHLRLEVRLRHIEMRRNPLINHTCSYFRHWLNWVILYSVWYEFDLMPYVRETFIPAALNHLISLAGKRRSGGPPRTACGWSGG